MSRHYCDVYFTNEELVKEKFGNLSEIIKSESRIENQTV